VARERDLAVHLHEWLGVTLPPVEYG
jgi:hypothetical protein